MADQQGIKAVIGIGSNSVRMLVAEINGNTGKRLLRDREGTRLFAGLDEAGNLSESAMIKTSDAVAVMAAKAREMGANAIDLFATSATRDARNKDAFAEMLQRKSLLTLETISGEKEAALSFFGATGEGFCGVIDIGGGSTELIAGEGMDVRWGFSCQMGAVRLHGMQPIRDHSDMPIVQALAAGLLEEQLRRHPSITMPGRWYGTGGTFTTLAAMVKGIRWTDRTFMHGTTVSLQDVRRLGAELADLSVEDRKKLPGLQPNRADIVVHGICILLAVMERLHIDMLTVSEYGNLDGYLKEKYGITLQR